jgi:hypothetical protein
MLKIKKIIFLGTVLSFFLKAGFVFALENNYPSILGYSIGNTFGEFVCYLFGLLTNLGFLISACVIAYGGVYYLISFGRGKFTSEAKDWLKAGVCGFLLVVLAYLILQTINPALTSCKMGILSVLNPNTYGNSQLLPGYKATVYQELPIGTLTENLLTKKMDSCFSFDLDGNPIDANANTQNILDPTQISNDRFDCLKQLADDGITGKARLVSALADKIQQLMNTCSCKGKCDDTCGGVGGCNQPTKDDCASSTPYICTGSCIGAGCIQAPNTTDCCPDGVKDKIEHGPVQVTIDGHSYEFHGLDEFRCPNPIPGGHSNCDDIKSFVQSGNGINKENWNKLNLLQQLMYLREKAGDIKNSIDADSDLLKKATYELNKCYLAIPYGDMLKAYRVADQSKEVILTKSFFDESKKPIDNSKYCTGFNYSDSECLKKCNDQCPDSSTQAIEKYKACPICQGNDQKCLDEQEKCIKTAYASRPCLNGPDSSKTFGDCTSSCQLDCEKGCESIDPLKSSNKYNVCKSKCNVDSQCVLNNSGTCLFGASNFIDCAKNSTDPGNSTSCINNAYLCKNGSDQYPGNPYCINGNCAKDSACPACSCATGSECNGYAYNDDPLTFYCEDNWWLNPNRDGQSAKPLGDKMYCSPEGEIPVGQTVDKAKKWAESIGESIAPIGKYIDLIKKAGNAKDNPVVGNYCKCGAKYENSQPICTSGCQYSKQNPISINNNGSGSFIKSGSGSGNGNWVNNNNLLSALTFPAGILADDDIFPPGGGRSGGGGATGGYSESLLESLIVPVGTLSPAFDENITSYTDILPSGTTKAPTVSATPYNPKASVVITQATSTTGKATVTVTATTTATVTTTPTDMHIYTVTFSADLNNNDTLSALTVSAGTLSPAFDKNTTSYTAVLPSGTNKAPTVAPTATDSKATLTTTQPTSATGTATVVVKAQDGTKQTYAVSFSVAGPGCSCIFVPCDGNSCNQMETYLSQLRLSISLDDTNGILTDLSYARKKTNECSLDSNLYGSDKRILSCTRAEDEIMSPITGGTVKYKDRTLNNYCYGAKMGKILNIELTDDWFCCENQAKK